MNFLFFDNTIINIDNAINIYFYSVDDGYKLEVHPVDRGSVSSTTYYYFDSKIDDIDKREKVSVDIVKEIVFHNYVSGALDIKKLITDIEDMELEGDADEINQSK